jgi:hypothetical protein
MSATRLHPALAMTGPAAPVLEPSRVGAAA